MPPKNKKSKTTKKKNTKKKTTKKKITRKKSSVTKKNNIDVDTKIIDDIFTNLDTSMSYDDMTKDGILEKLKDKLLHNILTTRYNYLPWFTRFNRGYEFVDFLTFYIKNFLQANNPIVNEIYLYTRNNNINRFSDFVDHYYLKNKIIWLREKLVSALDKYIIHDAPPLYYSDLASLFLRPKNIYLLKDNDYFITRREDEYKNKLDEIKNSINALKNTSTSYKPPPPPPQPPSAPSPKIYDKEYLDTLKIDAEHASDELLQKRAERGFEALKDPKTGLIPPELEDLYNDILEGKAGFKNSLNKFPLTKNIINSFTNMFLS